MKTLVTVVLVLVLSDAQAEDIREMSQEFCKLARDHPTQSGDSTYGYQSFCDAPSIYGIREWIVPAVTKGGDCKALPSQEEIDDVLGELYAAWFASWSLLSMFESLEEGKWKIETKKGPTPDELRHETAVQLWNYNMWKVAYELAHTACGTTIDEQEGL